MKNPGFLVKLPDGRSALVYNKQPLQKEKGKIILHLVDEQLKPIEENGKPKILIKDIHIYNEEMLASTIIGFID